MIYAFIALYDVPGQATLEVEARDRAQPARAGRKRPERFRAYDKAKALAGMPERLAQTEAHLAGLDQTLALLELAEGFEQIEGIARRPPSEACARRPGVARQSCCRQPPLRVDSSDGFAIYIGRSAGQNEQVTFKIGAADDLWLHARGIHGAHVIIKSGGRAVPEPTLREAAALAAYYSKARNEAAVEVDFAPHVGAPRATARPGW
ncbi:MAG: NFACT RNA binding domain-containing protein [Kouleothrix sp.]